MDRRWAIGLMLLSLACGGIYLVNGSGFVLDDWVLLSRRRFDGIGHLLGDQWHDRPVAGLFWLLTFGLVGEHPAVLSVVASLLVGIAAVLIYDVLRLTVGHRLGVLVAALWVLLPTHMSIEGGWLVCTAVALSLALGMASIRAALGTPSRRRLALVLALLAAAILTYETTAVLAAPGVVLLPWWQRRRVDLGLMVGVAGVVLAAGAYLLASWHSAREVQPIANLSLVLPANFSWGISGSAVVGQVALCSGAVAATLAAVVLVRTWGSAPAPASCAVVLVGLGVTLVGALPYLRYFYEPLGAGDRANAVSSIGSAMVWGGALAMAVRWRRQLGLAALAAFVMVITVTRIDRTRLWSAAATDADRVRSALVAAHPVPAEELVLHPNRMLRLNIGAFYDVSSLRSAVRLAYGDPDIQVRYAADEAEWNATPPERRFDPRPFIRVDDVDLIIDG